MAVEDTFRINLNQNLWGMIAAYGALGSAERWKLATLFWFATVASVGATVSFLATTFVYTRRYWREKR